MIRKLNEDNLVPFFYFLDTITAFNQNLSFKYLYFIAKDLLAWVTHCQSNNLAVLEECLHKWGRKEVILFNKISWFS